MRKPTTYREKLEQCVWLLFYLIKKGECLPNGYEMTMAKANESYNIWLQQKERKCFEIELVNFINILIKTYAE